MRERAITSTKGAGRQSGFTLVELAVVLGVLGLLAMTMTSGFDGVNQARERNAAKANAQQAYEAVRSFALRNKRLPCPDPSSNGDRGREPIGSCAGNIGWLPYESLGLDIPARGQRLRFGVYRSGSVSLAAPLSGGNDTPDLEGAAGFMTALAQAAGAVATTDAPYFVNGHSGPATTCSAGGNTSLVNPAFVIVAPVTNLNGGSGALAGFEAPNLSFAGASRCFAAPDTGAGSGYDDVVVVESLTSLLGWAMSTNR